MELVIGENDANNYTNAPTIVMCFITLSKHRPIDDLILSPTAPCGGGWLAA